MCNHQPEKTIASHYSTTQPTRAHNAAITLFNPQFPEIPLTSFPVLQYFNQREWIYLVEDILDLVI